MDAIPWNNHFPSCEDGNFPNEQKKGYISTKLLKRVSQKEHAELKENFNKFPYVRTFQQNIEIIASFKRDFCVLTLCVLSFNYSR